MLIRLDRENTLLSLTLLQDSLEVMALISDFNREIFLKSLLGSSTHNS